MRKDTKGTKESPLWLNVLWGGCVAFAFVCATVLAICMVPVFACAWVYEKVCRIEVLP